MSTATRTQIPVSTLTASTPAGAFSDLNDAGTAINQSTGMYVQIPSTAIPAGGNADRLLLYFANSYAGTAKLTVKAGVGGGATAGAAFRSGLGDFQTGNITATTGTAFVGPLDISRFIQLDNTIWIDFTANATGTIWAVLIPRAF